MTDSLYSTEKETEMFKKQVKELKEMSPLVNNAFIAKKIGVSLGTITRIMNDVLLIAPKYRERWEFAYPIVYREVSEVKDLSLEKVKAVLLEKFEEDKDGFSRTVGRQKRSIKQYIKKFATHKALLVWYYRVFNLPDTDTYTLYQREKENQGKNVLKDLSEIGFNKRTIKLCAGKVPTKQEQNAVDLYECYQLAQKCLNKFGSLKEVCQNVKITPAKVSHVKDKYDYDNDEMLLALLLFDKWRYAYKAKASNLAS
ncbi:hypothetical protein [Ligilactobacillus equi]|uniref:Uncharacterized protein n=1 Tax=Ligilactobacillus equi DSM 15833 = JCM 10991 TaxID=1423740 RepID=A0A0R1TA89_9LACO|nr:hypothetical protein [Ligilactobacillus equi]KRL78247.1 hypothetical protein FC36_GL001135 [Ligilactobacillus equi DSM 15833 = JCM 10991]